MNFLVVTIALLSFKLYPIPPGDDPGKPIEYSLENEMEPGVSRAIEAAAF